MTRLTIACKARDLTARLAELGPDLEPVLDESLAVLPDPRRAEEQERERLRYHAIVEEAIAGRERAPYGLTEAGEDVLRERLVADEEPRLSSEYDTREP